jgi:spore coat protein U-like protein
LKQKYPQSNHFKSTDVFLKSLYGVSEPGLKSPHGTHASSRRETRGTCWLDRNVKTNRLCQTGKDKKMRKIALIAAALAAVSTSAVAATVDGNFTVKVKVNANCFVAVTDVDFGTLTEVTAAATATGGAVSVRCSKNTPFTLALDAVGPMSNGTDTIDYSLALSGTSGTGAGLGVPQAVSFTLSGALVANPTASPGDYTDARKVTVTY